MSPHQLRLLPLLALPVGACSQTPAVEPGPCASAGLTAASRFPTGSPDGHPDPAGAKAAGQARAGRIRDAAAIRQAPDARAKVRVGDFLLANDKIAAYIEGAGESDGYLSFGGEILAIEPVGDDGRPAGRSQYGETLLGLSRQAIKPDAVTVLKDGSDGHEAIVRASGVLTNIPFLETFAGFFPEEYDFPAALDYVLEPGAEKLRIRLSFMNLRDQPVDFAGFQNIGFFHSARSQLFAEETGFDKPRKDLAWVGFDSGASGFAIRSPLARLSFLLEVSGFQYLQAAGLKAESCRTESVDYLEVIPAAPGIDGVRAALRRVDKDTSWREVRGEVREAGAPVPGALVHVVEEGGPYLTRALTGPDGRFLVHAPPRSTSLVVTHAGHASPPPVPLDLADTTAAIDLPAHGRIAVEARDAAGGRPLPVRIQVIPAAPAGGVPASFGVRDEARGRLHQEFAMGGDATLTVPAGEHRVVVSRGFEWELHDETVTVKPGETVTVKARLEHGVDSTGVMCADFHIHSFYSADSSDPVEYKVKGAIADGLEIPVSSEHEWIIDFQPVIQSLGLTEWAFGIPSEEFTTFTWGHFGIVPIQPRPDAVNNGAVAWVGRKPPEVFRTIAELPEKPVLIVNHPSGMGFGAYFGVAKLNRATGTGDPELWSDQFGAVEVFNDSDLEKNRNGSLADWFALLDAGKRVWAVGSSDSHHLRSSPVGYPRTCLRFGHDDPKRLSAEAVRDALGRGQATISGGLYLTVEGPGGAGPGSVLPAGPPPELAVTVQAPSWLEAKTLEVIVDGDTVETVQLQESMGPGPARRYEARVTAKPRESRPFHWVVLHASGGGRDLAPVAPGRAAFAASNPIFF